MVMRRRIVRNRRFTRRRQFRRRPLKRSRAVTAMKKSIVAATQEKKTYSSLATNASINNYVATVFGLTAPVVGPSNYQRIGNHVTLSGVRVNCNWTQTNNFTDDPAHCVYVYMFIVRSFRSGDSFSSRWFLNGSNEPVSFGSASELQRSEYRINTKENKVYFKKRVKLEHYKPGNNAKYSYLNDFYVPLNVKIKFDDDDATASGEIYPKVSVVIYALAPDQNPYVSNPEVSLNSYITWYYRE